MNKCILFISFTLMSEPVYAAVIGHKVSVTGGDWEARGYFIAKDENRDRRITVDEISESHLTFGNYSGGPGGWRINNGTVTAIDVGVDSPFADANARFEGSYSYIAAVKYSSQPDEWQWCTFGICYHHIGGEIVDVIYDWYPNSGSLSGASLQWSLLTAPTPMSLPLLASATVALGALRRRVARRSS